MAFEVPMKKSATLDRNSLSDKCGFMNVRKSFDKNTLNNDAFKKTVQKNQHQPTVKTSSRQPVISVASPSPAPIKPVKKTTQHSNRKRLFTQRTEISHIR